VQFANLQAGSPSLTHIVPKSQDVYPAGGSYPFKMVSVGDNTLPALADLLPSNDMIFQTFRLFQERAQSCFFPHVPNEVTEKEVERFLEDKKNNAYKAPDMLSLIFATLAVGMQIGAFHRNGGQWLGASMADLQQEGEVYRKAHTRCGDWRLPLIHT